MPNPTISNSYSLEYGTDSLFINPDSFHSQDIVLIHDDILATGGTALSTFKLINTKVSSDNIYFLFSGEIKALNGRELLLEAGIEDTHIRSLLDL